LGRGKQITCGSGGIIVTRSEEIARALRVHYNQLNVESLQESANTLLALSLMEVFMNPYLYWLPDGLPFLKIGETYFNSNFQMFRMNRVKYKLLHNWEQKLDTLNKIRISVSEEYKNALNLNRGIRLYSNVIPYLRFPVYLKNEEMKMEICNKYRHLGISPMYPGSISAINEIKEGIGDCLSPASTMIAKKLVSLPTHGFVDGIIRMKICSAIGNVLDHGFQNS
jgi:dTDP-4-amino-4,6-dideoxygalactose transaminase